MESQSFNIYTRNMNFLATVEIRAKGTPESTVDRLKKYIAHNYGHDVIVVPVFDGSKEVVYQQ